MWRPPIGPGGAAEEFINNRIKQLHEARPLDPDQRGQKPGGVLFSESTVWWVCGLGLVTGVAFLCLMIFGAV